MQEPGSSDASDGSPTVVLVIRAWYEHDRFVARVIFEPPVGERSGSVVVSTIEELCDAVARAVESLLPL